MASVLQEWDTGTPISSTNPIEQVYSDMAWAGLQQTAVYQNTTYLTSMDRSRISARIHAETENEPNGGPVTDGVQTPIDTPCN